MKALLLVAGAAAITTSLPAQGVVVVPRSDTGCTTSLDGRVQCTFYRSRGMPDSLRYRMPRIDSVLARRAALGLSLRATGTRRDTLGVFVESVTPRGPAELAGIVEGDRIASINGVDVRSSAADVDDDYANGLASHRLTREVQKLAPGARVTLRVYSGGRYRDVQVTAGKASDVFRMSGGMGIGFPRGGMMEFGGPTGAPMIFRTPGLPRDLPEGQLRNLRELAPSRIPFELRRPLVPARIRVLRTTT